MRRRACLGERVFDKPGAAGDKLALARAMRAVPTAAEARLWGVLPIWTAAVTYPTVCGSLDALRCRLIRKGA